MRQSKFPIDRGIVFAEYFNSESEVIRNGGFCTDMTFEKGYGTFDGVTSVIEYNKPEVCFGNGVTDEAFSVRAKIRQADCTSFSICQQYGAGYETWRFITSSGDDLQLTVYDGDGSHYRMQTSASSLTSYEGEWIEVVGTYDGSATSAGIKLYLNGSAISINFTDSNTYTAMHDFKSPLKIGANGEGDIDFVEIYNRELTAEEVKNLYEGKTYVKQTGDTELLSISANTGTIIDRYDASLTLTSVDVHKEGNKNVLKFNGSTSKIDTNTTTDLTGDITVNVWMYRNGGLSGLSGRFVDDGKFVFADELAGRLAFASDGATFVYSANNSLAYYGWYMVTAVRESDGTVNMYVNGVLSGSADQNSGTPATGTTNIIIGNRNASDRPFEGYLSNVVIYNGLLTAEEVTQLYSSTKKFYK